MKKITKMMILFILFNCSAVILIVLRMFSDTLLGLTSLTAFTCDVLVAVLLLR